MKHRFRGYALVELLVVLTVTAVMLTLAAGLIHQMLKLDRSARAASEVSSDLARLARDFRSDAHALASPERVERLDDRLILALAEGRSVEYQARPLDILRTLREGDKVRRYETYRRPSRASARFEVDRAGSRAFATLVLDRPVDGRDDSLYRDYRIEAELGKDQRLNPRPQQ